MSRSIDTSLVRASPAQRQHGCLVACVPPAAAAARALTPAAPSALTLGNHGVVAVAEVGEEVPAAAGRQLGLGGEGWVGAGGGLGTQAQMARPACVTHATPRHANMQWVQPLLSPLPPTCRPRTRAARRSPGSSRGGPGGELAVPAAPRHRSWPRAAATARPRPPPHPWRGWAGWRFGWLPTESGSGINCVAEPATGARQSRVSGGGTSGGGGGRAWQRGPAAAGTDSRSSNRQRSEVPRGVKAPLR